MAAGLRMAGRWAAGRTRMPHPGADRPGGSGPAVVAVYRELVARPALCFPRTVLRPARAW